MATSAAINLDRLPLSEDLLKYYRERIEKSEQDLQTVLNTIDDIKSNQEYQHKLEWELHQRTREITELQNALSDTQNYLFEERKSLLKVLAENDELRLQELKDRRKIRYLLALAGSAKKTDIQDETTYFKETLDKRFVRHDTSSKNTKLRSHKVKRDVKGKGKQREHIEESAEASSAANVGEDVPSEDGESDRDKEDDAMIGLTPTDQVELFKLQLKALRAQMDEQNKLHEETVNNLMLDRQQHIEEDSIRRKHDEARIEELLGRIQKLEGFVRENTREMLQTKRNAQFQERLLKEEKANLVTELSTIRQSYQEAKTKSESVEKIVETRIMKRNENLLAELRTQLAKYESELKGYKAKHEETESAYKKKINALQSKIDSMHSSYKSLKKRRDYEIEGFTNDILHLRKQLKTLEKHILKFGPLEDRELALLEIARNTGQKAEKVQGDLVGLKQKMYQVEQDLRSIAF